MSTGPYWPRTAGWMLVGAALAVPSACGNGLGPIACTLEARYGVNVSAVYSVTSVPITQGISGTLVDGDYVEVMELFAGTLAGAVEREGEYVVEVSADGYETWTRTDVEVLADECHVIPVALVAKMMPRADGAGP